MIKSHDLQQEWRESEDWTGVDGDHDVNDQTNSNQRRIVKRRVLSKLTDYSKRNFFHWI